jgi:U3 small nucleolar ribonucleoprotein component
MALDAILRLDIALETMELSVEEKKDLRKKLKRKVIAMVLSYLNQFSTGEISFIT